ncbi:energy-coupling factor transporter transmembrane component T [Gemella haemolysans]|uniref:Cobalt transport protein n=1 Tax=Gemella haemolysans ATCC 10379 TaxID=546270 RepID=C5NUL8_9BACL|nr:energy-coupling factor transporter transmembrane component T [Gemella haemolysans]EER69112.1 cobalt transport protein [Gemella haemolysans ATCC 10379]KAA8708119.1 cobalt ABC transporter permease [Gemella haemolysans]UBH82094.1 energy-coupling factor transporter transmembrane protein EcfT [Gemella haemolysans]VEI37988.1 ABC-type cobalt transport system, permease component CbiQ and related transporters [Gemella haemolysans]
MKKKIISPTLTLIIMVLTIWISFSKLLVPNIIIIATTIFLLFLSKYWNKLLIFIFLPLLPAIGSAWAIIVHSSNYKYALLIFTRTYSFAALGLILATYISLVELLKYFEQHGLSSNIVYGLLVVIQALPRIQYETQMITKSSRLRGIFLPFWSPYYYAKAIFIALTWQPQISEAMTIHAYEDFKARTHYNKYTIDKIKSLFIIVLFSILLILLLIINK